MSEQGPKRDYFVVKMESMTARDPMSDYVRSMFKLWVADAAGVFHKDKIRIIPPALTCCSDIPLGRNTAIRKMLTPEFIWDAWLWVDDDQVFEPEDIIELVNAMRRGAVDIVSPLIAKRTEAKHYAPVAYKTFDEARGQWTVWSTGWEEPNLYETPAVGTGFCLVKREVFERLHDPWYERFQSPRHRDRWFGNDLYFCHKAKEAGFRVWLHSGVEVGHLGVKPRYVRKDFVESGQQKKLLGKLEAAGPIEASDKPDLNTAGFWDEHWKDTRWIEAQNRPHLFKEVFKFVPEKNRVLHFGCGDGQLARYLIDESEDLFVHGVDISPEAISACRRKNISCQLLQDMNNPQGITATEPYDILLITGWVERLVDPGKTIQELIKYLKPDGQVVVVGYHSVFGPSDVPEHHHLLSKHNLGELMNRFGRVLELSDFVEYFGVEGQRTGVPMLVSRSTIEKAQPDTDPVQAGEEIINAAGR